MTDSPETNPDTLPTDVDESTTTEDVPPDVEWEVAVQEPYDPAESGGLTPTIIAAVAEAEGVSPRDVRDPPLFEVVDTAALEEAMFNSNAETQGSECSTEFMYRDYRVAVQTDGWVIVHEPTEA